MQSLKMDFKEIYNQHSRKIYRVCLGFLNDPEKAKDLTQETFLAAWQGYTSFRNESSLGTWVYRIATNKCLRYIEKEKRLAKLQYHDEQGNSDTESMVEERLNFLKARIAELPEVDRIIITLVMEGVARDQIADITGLTHNNVRVKVHRLKERLLKKFKEHGKF